MEIQKYKHLKITITYVFNFWLMYLAHKKPIAPMFLSQLWW